MEVMSDQAAPPPESPPKRTDHQIQLDRAKFALDLCRKAFGECVEIVDGEPMFITEGGEHVPMADAKAKQAIRRALYALEMAEDSFCN